MSIAIISSITNIFRKPTPEMDVTDVAEAASGPEDLNILESSSRPETPPFIVELRCESIQGSGHFTPAARVSLSPAFQSSGLMRELEPEDVIVLIMVLSCVTPNGNFVATLQRLAPMLGISNVLARKRLRRLTLLRWRGAALLSVSLTETGLHLYTPSLLLFEVQTSAVCPVQPNEKVREPRVGEQMEAEIPVNGQGHRAEIIARSRALYARPRAEVEADIERFLNRDLPMEQRWKRPTNQLTNQLPLKPGQTDAVSRNQNHAVSAPQTVNALGITTPDGQQWLTLKKRLVEAGVTSYQATSLLDSYTFDRIERQLEWLPHRQARNPIAYLLAAIKSDYAAPIVEGIAADDVSASRVNENEVFVSQAIGNQMEAGREEDAVLMPKR